MPVGNKYSMRNTFVVLLILHIIDIYSKKQIKL